HATEAGDRLGTMGDDGEKFGAWPTTFEHCWGKGRWVDRFFEALESNAAWLTTVRPSDWLGSNPPVGRIYVPTGSYAEMGEWALPPDESRAFTAAVHRAQETKAPERRWLRGAFWRNFQVKYREINDLHKQMLRTSARVEAMPPGAAREAALDHLYRGQSNDCYWHGLFGGIYIAHMRAATLAHLIAAEDAADRALGTESGGELRDLDLDGRDEVRLASDGQVVTIDLDEGGGIGAWDVRAARHALTGVLRRRPEAYHEILRRHEAEASKPPKGKGAGDAPASIHDIVQVKEPGLAARLVYDDYERRSGLLRVLPRDATAASWAAGGRGDLADFVGGPYRIVRLDRDVATMARDGHATIDGAAFALSVETEVSIAGGRLDPTLRWTTTVRNDGDRAFEARLGSEWALTMLGGGGNPEAWWEVDGERTGHDGTGAASLVDQVGQGNSWLGLSVATSVSPAADAWRAPIETISNSEAGFERVYQGGALLLSWVVRIAPGGSWSATIEHRATVAVDRAEEELGAVLANRT
ncbi:MAG TPA: alpha-amylase/4-alpha-glucanotransferase domain-containing protein, partial [Candidatus Limnocylindrales bacterium]